MRLVLDTSVVVAAMRSGSGASAALLDRALAREYELLLSVALALEYEAVMTRPQHLAEAGLSRSEIDQVFHALLDIASPIHTGFFWPPFIEDKNDAHVLSLALVGRADSLVTHNLRHFAVAALQYGINLESPAQALRRLRR